MQLNQTENSLKADYEQKLSQIQTIIGPLKDLTANGKSLKEGILDFVMSSDGIVKVVDKARDQIV